MMLAMIALLNSQDWLIRSPEQGHSYSVPVMKMVSTPIFLSKGRFNFRTTGIGNARMNKSRNRFVAP